MDKIFVDTDIIIDLLTERKPFYDQAAELFSLARKGKFECCTSAVSIANIFYILSRFDNKNFARRNVMKLRRVVSVCKVDEDVVDVALASNHKDFEDALQYYAALESGLNCIITRNKKDFPKSDIPVWSAGEYLRQRNLEN